MPERQLHLFQPARPLASRLGEEFFAAAPRQPGVYIMTGVDEQVLYVGQSKNLRARLGSYKNARRDRTPRKVLRLVHEVRSITWEKCESAEAALLRESELLRIHRPKFNRANVYPTYTYFWLTIDDKALTLGRTNHTAQTAAGSQTRVYGPFKSSAVASHAALSRLIWTVARETTNLSDFPSGLLCEKPPRILTIDLVRNGLQANLVPRVTDFLAGTSDSLLSFLHESLPGEERLCAFQRALHAYDLEVLAQFYRLTTSAV